MVFSRDLTYMLLLTLSLLGVDGQASAASLVASVQDCLLTPAAGNFRTNMTQPPAAPTAGRLPANPGAWSTLIVPGQSYSWDPKGGLVESPDGSVVLHGVMTGPTKEAGQLNVVVLADYEPLTRAVISSWNAERTERLSRAVGTRARLEAEGAAVVFDIELPKETVPIGTYREIQTLAWYDGGSIDARRWTVSAGPQPPAAVECADADAIVSDMPTRSMLERDGEFIVRSPRATTLAVMPIRANGADSVRFVRFEQARHGWQGQMGKGVELAAVWEGPFTGPGTSWISSFWSARPALITPR